METRNKIIEFIKEYNREYNVNPTYSEIASALELSKSTVHFHVLKLEQMGLVSRKPGMARYISLVPPA